MQTKESKIKQSWKFVQAQDESAEIKASAKYHKKYQDDEVETSQTVNGKNTELATPKNGESEQPRRADKGEIDKEDTVKGVSYCF